MQIRFWATTALWALGLAACARPAGKPQEAATAAAAPLATTPDQSPGDALLLASARIALPPTTFSAADLPEPGSTAAALLVKNCGQCHAVPSPAMHAATDWPRILRRMWLRMDMLPDSFQVAVPAVGDRAALSRYLMANALKVAGEDLPAGAGRDKFVEMCSRCHTLPDPRLHSPQDWPGVFMRMEENMNRMQVRPPNRSETEAILLYLQELPSPKR
jgi:cytochrome c2